MKYVKRYSLIFFAVLLLFAFFPVQALAVDPMSSAMMANAFAQAIAAYGSSQGVAMTFDVASTDGIGEGVHELWKDFRASTNESDDFDSVASVYQASNPYSPQDVNIFGQSMKVVGISLNEDVKPLVDDFWNWLLTGPAEMVKVDNEYYQFSAAQIGANAVPISVITVSSFFGQPLPVYDSSSWPSSAFQYTTFDYYGTPYTCIIVSRYSNNPVYIFAVDQSSYYEFFAACASSGQFIYETSSTTPPGSWSGVSRAIQSPALYTTSVRTVQKSYSPVLNVPVYSSTQAGYDAIADELVGNAPADTIGVRAYDDDGIAVIPDTNAFDYVDTAPPIPLNIPWDDTLYGDGTGTLTDAQKEAIAGDLSDALADTGTVDLAETDNPSPNPGPDIGEVMFPLIPISLPSFNFSLSGIWHYVREWVSSLGAWLSMMFTIWAALPYAMVVPVYACIVIVIVLGIYRRFFM